MTLMSPVGLLHVSNRLPHISLAGSLDPPAKAAVTKALAVCASLVALFAVKFLLLLVHPP